MRFPEYDGLDATALGQLVAKRQVTPTELLEAAIERADARNPGLNAIVTRFDDEARKRAAGFLPAGPFSGVPFLLKDLGAYYEGWPLTASCRLFAGAVAPFDAEIVRRFKAAGLVMFGQTNLPELGIMPVTESVMRGPCRNPWNLEHTCGGSSGGSGAAVAARIVPMAHGNDAGGSIRIPSSACGLFGLKPTRGRVSLGPAYGDEFAGMVQEHVLTRSVRDSAAMLDLLAGHIPGDPYAAPAVARPFRQEVAAPPGRLRIAFTKQSLFGHSTHPDCAAAVDDAVALLSSLGHELVEARPEFDRNALVRAYLVVWSAVLRNEIERTARELGRRVRPGLLEAETWALAVAGEILSANTLNRAIGDMGRASRATAPFFEQYDLFLTSTLAHPPLVIGALALKKIERMGVRALLSLRSLPFLPRRSVVDLMMDQMSQRGFEATGNTMLFNQTGQPAMSVPLYWSSAGLPIGVQLVARFGGETQLFRLAAQLEQARPWAQRLPPVCASAPSAP